MFLSRANGPKIAGGNSVLEIINSKCSSIVQASATRAQTEVSLKLSAGYAHSSIHSTDLKFKNHIAVKGLMSSA